MPGIEFPKIRLSVNLISNSETLELVYFDNGSWKKTDDDTFGVHLIDALTEQLEGSYDLSVDESGSTYTFKLKQLD